MNKQKFKMKNKCIIYKNKRQKNADKNKFELLQREDD